MWYIYNRIWRCVMNNKGRKIKKSEKELEQQALMEEDISIFVTIGLAILFIFIGIVLGYLLYKLALNR